MRPLYRLRKVHAAQIALMQLRLEVLHESPEGPAGHAVLRHPDAPRAGPQQAHPVLPSAVPVVVVVVVAEQVGSMRRRRVVVGTARRGEDPSARGHFQRRQAGRQRPPASIAAAISMARAAIRVIGVAGVRRAAVEQDEGRRVLGGQPRQRSAGTLQPRPLRVAARLRHMSIAQMNKLTAHRPRAEWVLGNTGRGSNALSVTISPSPSMLLAMVSMDIRRTVTSAAGRWQRKSTCTAPNRFSALSCAALTRDGARGGDRGSSPFISCAAPAAVPQLMMRHCPDQLVYASAEAAPLSFILTSLTRQLADVTLQ